MSNSFPRASAKTVAITRAALLPTIGAFWLLGALAIAVTA